MMNLAQTRKRQLLYVLLGVMFILAGFIGILIALFKHLYGLGLWTAQIATWVTAIWWLPGIPWLWQHVSVVSPGHPSGPWSVYIFLFFGIMLVGVVFCGWAGRLSHYIRQSGREADVERLKNERLGYTHPPGSRVTQITDSTIHGHFIGGDVGAHAQVSYAHNDLSEIRALVNYMLTHMEELPFTPFQRVQFKMELDGIQQECASPVPNPTRLRKGLNEVWHTLRHLGEAGTAHVLVGHWPQILDTLQRWGHS